MAEDYTRKLKLMCNTVEWHKLLQFWWGNVNVTRNMTEQVTTLDKCVEGAQKQKVTDHFILKTNLQWNVVPATC